MKKARIWKSYSKWGPFGYLPTGRAQWNFYGHGYWAEADTFELLMEYLKEIFK